MEKIYVPLITNMMVMLTNQCNLRCPFCFIEKDAKRMTYQTLFDTVQFLIGNGEKLNWEPRLVFFGGEPMTEWDELIVPIVDYIRNEYQKPFSLSMTTNMTLLTEERLKFMKDNGIVALYSIDGDADTMAVNRPFVGGKSPFDTIDAITDKVVEYDPKAAARMTLYRPTIKNLYHDLLYVTGKGFGSVSLLPNLFDHWSDDDIAEFNKQITYYGDHLIDEFRAGRSPLIFQQYSEMFYKIMLRNRCVRDGEIQTLAKCHGCGKCGFGLGHHATCDTDGNIFGCLHLGGLDTSSIFYLGDIYQGVDPDRSRALVDQCDDEVSGGLDCQNCLMSEICDRGCAPNNYLWGGKFKTPPEIYCYFYRTIMQDAIRVCNVLGKEQNELFREVFQRRVMEG